MSRTTLWLISMLGLTLSNAEICTDSHFPVRIPWWWEWTGHTSRTKMGTAAREWESIRIEDPFMQTSYNVVLCCGLVNFQIKFPSPRMKIPASQNLLFELPVQIVRFGNFHELERKFDSRIRNMHGTVSPGQSYCVFKAGVAQYALCACREKSEQ